MNTDNLEGFEPIGRVLERVVSRLRDRTRPIRQFPGRRAHSNPIKARGEAA